MFTWLKTTLKRWTAQTSCTHEWVGLYLVDFGRRKVFICKHCNKTRIF